MLCSFLLLYIFQKSIIFSEANPSLFASCLLALCPGPKEVTWAVARYRPRLSSGHKTLNLPQVQKLRSLLPVRTHRNWFSYVCTNRAVNLPCFIFIQLQAFLLSYLLWGSLNLPVKFQICMKEWTDFLHTRAGWQCWNTHHFRLPAFYHINLTPCSQADRHTSPQDHCAWWVLSWNNFL